MEHSVQMTEQWFRQYGEPIYRRCRRLLRDDAAAWDMTQEVFVRAHKSANSFRGDTSVLSWLLTIADRRCFTAMRKRRSDQEKIENLAMEGVEYKTSEGMEQMLVECDLVSKLLGRFDEDVQQIVVLRFFDELEQEEIASRLGISRKTVHRKLEKFFASSRKILRSYARAAASGRSP